MRLLSAWKLSLFLVLFHNIIIINAFFLFCQISAVCCWYRRITSDSSSMQGICGAKWSHQSYIEKKRRNLFFLIGVVFLMNKRKINSFLERRASFQMIRKKECARWLYSELIIYPPRYHPKSYVSFNPKCQAFSKKKDWHRNEQNSLRHLHLLYTESYLTRVKSHKAQVQTVSTRIRFQYHRVFNIHLMLASFWVTLFLFYQSSRGAFRD